eukprot:6105440-Amphidinium_carterae.1
MLCKCPQPSSAQNLKGTSQESRIRTLSAVTKFEIDHSMFEGALPESGLPVMSAVTKFGIYTNSFKGTLPGNGLQ